MVHGDGDIAESTFQKRLDMFRSGHFNLEDQEHFNRVIAIDNDQIEIMIKNSPGHMIQDIAEILNISHMSIVRHLENTWIHILL